MFMFFLPIVLCLISRPLARSLFLMRGCIVAIPQQVNRGSRRIQQSQRNRSDQRLAAILWRGYPANEQSSVIAGLTSRRASYGQIDAALQQAGYSLKSAKT
jgi:hypothetical protein